MPGEMAHVVKTTDGCCDKYEVVCKPETCAVQPPTCSPPQVMRNSNPGACCPTFKCGKWRVQGILSPFPEGWNRVELKYLSKIDIEYHKYMSCTESSERWRLIHCLFSKNVILHVLIPQISECFYLVLLNLRLQSFTSNSFIVVIFVLQVQLFWILVASTKSD